VEKRRKERECVFGSLASNKLSTRSKEYMQRCE